MQPSVDAIQEVSVQTSNYAAEYSGGGGYFNVTMRSGGNQYHGSGYDYLVNEVLNAGEPFAFANPNPVATAQGLGTSTIAATAPAYAPGSATAKVAVTGTLTPNPIAVVQNTTANLTLTLSQVAPPGGLTVGKRTRSRSRRSRLSGWRGEAAVIMAVILHVVASGVLIDSYRYQ